MFAVGVMAIIVAGGCRANRRTAAPTEPGAAATTQPVDPLAPFRLVHIRQQAGSDPAARPDVEAVSCLEVFHLSVPFGTISNDAAFWKRIDETCVDPVTQQVLFSNGIRVGLAQSTQWPYFRELIEKHPLVARRSILSAREVNGIEVGLKKDVASQTIFYFPAGGGELVGRTYDYCENFMALSFQPAPRKSGTLRIALCPVVRAARRVLQFGVNNGEQEFEYVRPEQLFDLNLRADVPQGTFLVVAPSTEGKWSTSLGRAFLVEDGPAERFEHILLLVPRPIEIPDNIPISRAMAN